MKPQSFVRVATLSDLAGAGPFAVSAKGLDLVVARGASGWRAFDGRCPHQGALLSEGEIDGASLVCRNHRWRFSIDSGRREDGPECLASYPAVERDGALYLDLSAVKPTESAAPAHSLDDLRGPRPLPILGNAHQLGGDAHLVLERWAAQYGPTFKFRIGPQRLVATTDTAVIAEVLRERPQTFRRWSSMDRVISEIGIRGVFNAEGDAWRAQRRLSVAALAQGHVRTLYPKIRMVAERFQRRLERAADSGETLDVVEELKRFTVDVTMLIVFGHDVNTIEQSGDVIQRELEIILPGISRRLFAAVPHWRYVKLPSDRRLDLAFERVSAWLSGLLNEARRRPAEPERDKAPSNFIEAMLASPAEDGKPFADEIIMSNLLTMVIAGEDTTAFSTAWAMHELCDAPQWASEIRREANAVAGPLAVPQTLDAVNALAVAGAVANESMRLRHVAPINGFEANVDTRLGPYAVPRGTTILLLARPQGLEAVNFADPTAFRPERWLTRLDGPHDVSTYQPFGSGPRVCPGRSLALIEMRTMLSVLCGSFDIERVGERREVAEQLGFTMSPAGLKVRLRRREANALRPAA